MWGSLSTWRTANWTDVSLLSFINGLFCFWADDSSMTHKWVIIKEHERLSETGPVQVHQVQVQLLCTSFIYFVLYLNTFYLSIFYLVSVKSTNVLKYQHLSTRVEYHVCQWNSVLILIVLNNNRFKTYSILYISDIYI